MKLAAQAYTFRAAMAADPAAALRRLRQTGFELVELAGLHGWPATQIRRTLDAAGVSAVAAHVPWKRLAGDTKAVVAELAVLGATDVVVPAPPDERRAEGLAGYRRFGTNLAALARRLANDWVRLHYHNHAWELARGEGGLCGLEVLAEAAGPDVGLELDLCWLAAGGGSVLAWLQAVDPARLRLVHLKDVTYQDGRPRPTAVGTGVLDWPAVLAACHTAGVKYGVVEEDNPPTDPFTRLDLALRNLRDIKASGGMP